MTINRFSFQAADDAGRREAVERAESRIARAVLRWVRDLSLGLETGGGDIDDDYLDAHARPAFRMMLRGPNGTVKS